MLEAVDWVGPVPFVLSITLALATRAACATALLFREALRGPAVRIGSLQGITGAACGDAPGAGSIDGARRPRSHGGGHRLDRRARIDRLPGVLFLFATPLNAFSFLYLAMLSLSIWALEALIGRMPVRQSADQIEAHAPVRVVFGYPLIYAAPFLALWLRPARRSRWGRRSGLGMTT